MIFAIQLLVGALVLGVGAYLASRRAWGSRPSDYRAPGADLRSLEELRARRDRRFGSGIDRTRGVKR